MKKRYTAIIPFLLFLAFLVPTTINHSAYADEGSGYDGTGTSAACNNYIHAYNHICSDGNGGASWHIYSSTEYEEPVYDPNILTVGQNYIQTIKSTCSSQNYAWYVVYGWDGHLRENGGIVNNYVFYGPLNWLSYTIDYNTNYGAISYNDYVAGNFTNGQQMTKEGAIELYRNVKNGDLTNQNIAYFCVPNPSTDLYSVSSVSNRESTTAATETGNYTTTNGGTPTNQQTTAETSLNIYDDNESVAKAKSVAITFSHNLFSKSQRNDVRFTIKRTLNGANGFTSSGVTISMPASTDNSSNSTGSSFSGSVNFQNKDTGFTDFYTGEPRNYSDSGEMYVLRDYYNIKFTQPGTYKFCETVYDESGKQITAACSTITIGWGGTIIVEDPRGCNSIAPESWTKRSGSSLRMSQVGVSLESDNGTVAGGITSTVTKIKNNGYGNKKLTSDWSDKIYAEPQDEIEWIHCYFPGAQYAANHTSTKNNNHSSSNGRTDSGRSYSITNQALSTWWNTNSWNNTNRMEINTFRNDTENPDFATPVSSNIPFNNHVKPSKTTILATGNTTVQKVTDKYTIPTNYDSAYFSSSTNKNYARGRTGQMLTETSQSFAPSQAYVSNGASHEWIYCHGSGDDYTCDDESHNTYYPSTGNVTPTDKSQASVIIPYNYENSTSVTLGQNLVYAGETVRLNNFSVTTSPKTNSNVHNGNDSYATVADGAIVKLIAYTTSSAGSEGSLNVAFGSDLCDSISHNSEYCGDIYTSSGMLNADSNHDGEQISLFDGGLRQYTVYPSKSFDAASSNVYNVYDEKAGYQYCVRAAVYPATSGADTNTKSSGNNEWYISEPSCAIIAKKPSFQVWGGSMFTAGNIHTSVSEKRVIAGTNNHPFDYSAPSSPSNTTIFGSWIELSIIHPKSTIYQLASGAATGEKNNNSNMFSNLSDISAGGSHEGGSINFCTYHIPLTIPNECSDKNATDSTTSVNTIPAPSDKSAIIAHFANASSVTNRCSEGNVFAGGAVVGSGEDSNRTSTCSMEGKDLEIKGDILYANSETGYSSLTEIPKLFIYAKNIYISCSVNRIDAILIADEVVNTCADAGDLNDRKRSNQLKINGSIIADKIILGRTYGASTGNNSGTPAEIINYDATLYLWGAASSSDGAYGNITSVYQTELAPRY